MAEPNDPSLYGTIIDVVNGGYATFQAYANQAFNLAVQSAQTLRSADFTFTPIDVDFNVNANAGSFVPPPRPTRTIDPFESPDTAPDELSLQPRTLSTDLSAQAPQDLIDNSIKYVEPGGAPGALTATAPGDPPTLEEVEIPVDTADYTLPPVPTLYELDIPDAPPINEVEFEGERPNSDLAVPVNPVSFTEQAYTSDLATAIRAKLTEMLQGGTGLDPAVEAMFFDRARAREDETALKARQEVASDFASRGFEEPPGIMAKRLLQVTQGNQNQSNAQNRDITIRLHEVRIQQLNFAITNTINWEQAFLQAHLQAEQRRFDALKFQFEATLNIFNARVALHNSLVQQYQADASVFRDRVQAELVKAEIYKSQIEGQRVIGEINKTIVDQYVATITGIRQQAEIYRTRVEAARIQLEGNGLIIEAHRTKVQAFAESVRAYAVEWEGYNSRVRAALGRVEAADGMARIYATRVQAWATKYQAEFEKVRTQLQGDELQVRLYDSNIRKYIADVEGERSRVQADATALGADAQVLSAAGQIAIAESNKLDRAAEIAIAKGRAQADIRLENARTNLQASLQVSGYYLQALQTLSQSSTQLAGSAMSAINVSGGVSGSVGQSYSYGLSTSRSWGWAGEVETVSPPTY